MANLRWVAAIAAIKLAGCATFAPPHPLLVECNQRMEGKSSTEAGWGCSLPYVRPRVGDTMLGAGPLARQVEGSGLPTLVMVTAEWCSPCHFNQSVISSHRQDTSDKKSGGTLPVRTRLWAAGKLHDLNIVVIPIDHPETGAESAQALFEEGYSLPVVFLLRPGGAIAAMGKLVYEETRDGLQLHPDFIEALERASR